PPVGPARWRPAAPHPGWPGVRDATAPAPSAPQPFLGPDPILGGHGFPPFDEDCLTLNLWTPGTDAARRPVLVWIHGGGFVSGSGSLPIYAGDTFARNGDVVVVGLTYRIGPLGYLYPGGDEAGDSANVWFTDQLQALRWIRDNIAAFGGDPDNVTVAGQSGGAYSTAALAVHPVAGRLFHRAILQSPPLGLPLPTPDESLERTAEFVRAAGVDTVGDMRALPWEKLVEATIAMFLTGAEWGKWRVPFLPVRDDATLARHPLTALVDGAAGDKEILVGWTGREATFAFGLDPQYADATRDQVVRRLADAHGDRAEAAYDAYADARPGAHPRDVLIDFVSDDLFRLPCRALADARTNTEKPVWAYQFDYASLAYDGRLGATHCLELPFTFHNADRWAHAPVLHGADPRVLDELGAAMHRAWLAFVRTGDPNHDRLPHWPRYTAPEPITMRFDTDTHTAPAVV
ncbi:MAG: carboxylesterase family protein, partial [Streptomycetaceae bacterium]|nr:carboxylesterase family protein [Streptomycetaceae bacterium]